MDVRRFAPEDAEALSDWVTVTNTAAALDSAWLHPRTLRSAAGALRHGWDGEPDVPYLGHEDGEPVAAGSVAVSDWDNLHLAWLGVQVHPDHRRRGLGSELFEALAEEARALGRTVVGVDGWDSEGSRGFGAHHGLEVKSVAVNRRQTLADVDWPLVERLHAEATERAAGYELVRRVGETPDDELDAVAELSASINDAPTDDLDVEDEVFPPERIRAYERAQLARGMTLHRVLARHRESGELAGHSVVVVDQERPHLGHQHDTSVVGSHRGHRLGLLLKTDMNLWLRDAEPQLATLDTWNAESNDHMIGVNELIGYRAMGRQLELQKKL